MGLANAYPPCGSPSQQLLTLDEARAQLGDQLKIPSDPDANASNVDKVARCDEGHTTTVITFTTGVRIYLMPPLSKFDAKKAVAQDSDESVLGSVNGRPAWVITPDLKTDRHGSVNFNGGGNWIIVEGNSQLSGEDLQRIASSIPD